MGNKKEDNAWDMRKKRDKCRDACISLMYVFFFWAGLLLVGVTNGFGIVGYVRGDQIYAFLNQFSTFK